MLQLACGNGNILVILFKKIGYFFSKIRKKWKKSKKNILKIINITHSIYALMYVLKKKFLGDTWTILFTPSSTEISSKNTQQNETSENKALWLEMKMKKGV